jgi:hypothetical protein
MMQWLAPPLLDAMDSTQAVPVRGTSFSGHLRLGRHSTDLRSVLSATRSAFLGAGPLRRSCTFAAAYLRPTESKPVMLIEV